MIASELRDYEALYPELVLDVCEDCTAGIDYLTTPLPARVEGIVMNPPYGDHRAVKFAEKAVTEADYVALLLTARFLETAERFWFFERHPYTVMWSSSDRLNGMRRFG